METTAAEASGAAQATAAGQPTDTGTGQETDAEIRSPIGMLSPSRASDFVACPLRYRFRVIDKLPEQPTPEAARGTVVHAVLERLFDLPAGERTVEAADGLVEPEWQQLVAAEPELASVVGEEFFPTARELLDRYFTLEDPRRLEPADREAYVECRLESGLGLRGYIDRVDVAADGAIRLVDYKTGKAPGEAYEQRALFQMRFYALVMWRTRGVLPRLLRLVYLGSGHVLQYAPDEADLRATERKLLAIWTAIQRARSTGEWRASPGPLCGWCDHQVRCPAWGGTPPPLPDSSEAAGSAESPSAADL